MSRLAALRRFTTGHAKALVATAIVVMLLGSGSFAALRWETANTSTPEARSLSVFQAASSLVGTSLDLEDADGDELPDVAENYVYGSDPNNWDSSGSQIPDGWLAKFEYSPSEAGAGSRLAAMPPRQLLPVAYGGDYPRTWQLTLYDVYSFGRPATWNESADGVHQNGLDPREWDNSGTGIPDGWFVAHDLNPREPGIAERRSSQDELTVKEEYNAGTDPRVADTDQDGLTDGQEMRRHGTNPLRRDTAGHGVPDGWLVRYGLNASDPATSLQDVGNKGMTVKEVFAYNIDRFGPEKTLVGEGLDPTKSSQQGGPIPDGWLIRYDVDPLASDAFTAVRWKASDWKQSQFLAQGLGGLEAIPDLAWTLADKYAYGRPASWQESVQGPWLGGLDPSSSDTDNDGIPDINEVRGWYIQRKTSINPSAELETVRTFSDPTRVDTDGDGLNDTEEYLGLAVRDGVEFVFSPSDPSNHDTAFSGLTDGEKVLGFTRDGVDYAFNQGDHTLDPTAADSSGGFMRDGDAFSYWHERYLFYKAGGDYEFPFSKHRQIEDWVTAMTGSPGAGATRAQLAELFRPDGDLNGDGILNLVDPDADGDGILLNGIELDPALLRFSGIFTDPEAIGNQPRPPTDPASPDTDGDTLSDVWEIQYGRYDAPGGVELDWSLNPVRWSSFGDEHGDADHNLDHDTVRRWYFTNNGLGFDADSHVFEYTNGLEEGAGTDPHEADEDFDLVSEAWRRYWGLVYPGVIQQAIDPSVEPSEPLGDLEPTSAQIDPLLQASIRDIRGGSLRDLELSAVSYVRFVEAARRQDVQLQPGETIPEGDFYANIVVLRHKQLTDASIARVHGRAPLLAPRAAEIGVNPYLGDTDGDGMPDAWEAMFSCTDADGQQSPSPIRFDPDADPDADGLANIDEYSLFVPQNPPTEFATDPCVADTDMGGLADGLELFLGLDPRNPRDDHDVADSTEDQDLDGLPDSTELDEDLLPTQPDTDGDGLIDGPARFILESEMPASFIELGIARQPQSSPDGPGFQVFGERTSNTHPLTMDTSGDGIPDGWLEYQGFLPTVRAPQSVAQAYAWQRPMWWVEDTHGPWWWGFSPRTIDVDGDGISDRFDDDLDSDGLNDRNGEDPVPVASHFNRAFERPTTILTAHAWGECAGDPNTCRRANFTADYDSNGVPDRLDRAPTRLRVDSVAGTSLATAGSSITVRKGDPFHVVGKLDIDCSTGFFTCATNTAAPQVPNRVVAIETNAGRVIGLGFTATDGTFDVEACLCGSRDVDVPAFVPALGVTGAPVSIDANPASIPLGEGLRLQVRSYNTTATFFGLQDATQDSTHPQYGSIAAIRNGDPDIVRATAGSLAQIATPLRVTATTDFAVDAPSVVAWGSTLEGSVRLLDSSGLPVGGVTIDITWLGSSEPLSERERHPQTRADGLATFSFRAIPAAPVDEGHALIFNYAGSGAGGLLQGKDTTQFVGVRFPTDLTALASVDLQQVAVGQPLTVSGVLTSRNQAVSGAMIQLSMDSILLGSDETDPLGRYSIRVQNLPVTTSPGTHELRVRFAGTPSLVSSQLALPTFVRASSVTALVAPPNVLTLGATIQVRGTVSIPGVGPLAAVPVSVSLSDVPLATVTTNAAGAFEMLIPWPANAIPAGTKVLKASFSGTPEATASTASSSVLVVAPTRIKFDAKVLARLAANEITGILEATDGTPLPGRLLNLTLGPDNLGTALTDAQGRFKAKVPANLLPDIGSVRVQGHFNDTENLFLESRGSHVYQVKTGSRLELGSDIGSRREVFLRGTLETNETEPIGSAAIAYTFGNLSGVATTGTDGRFEARLTGLKWLPLGPVKWTAEFAGTNQTAPTKSNQTTLIASSSSVVVDAPREVGAGGSMLVKALLLEDDGKAAAGFPVAAYRLDDGAEQALESTSNPLQFEIHLAPDMVRGNHTLHLMFGGNQTLAASAGAASFAVKEPVTIDIRFLNETTAAREPVTVELRLLNASGVPIPRTTIGVVANTAPLPFLATTDSEGRATVVLPAPHEGELIVQARFIGSTSQAATQSAASLPVEMAAPTVLGAPPAFWLIGFTALVALAVAALVGVSVLAWPQTSLIRALERTIRRIEAGDPYAAAVMLAYKRLTLYAERYGFFEAPSETAREFVTALGHVVPLVGGHADTLIDLFDHARYGTDGTLTVIHRQQAVDALRSIRVAVEQTARAVRHAGVPT